MGLLYNINIRRPDLRSTGSGVQLLPDNGEHRRTAARHYRLAAQGFRSSRPFIIVSPLLSYSDTVWTGRLGLTGIRRCPPRERNANPTT